MSALIGFTTLSCTALRALGDIVQRLTPDFLLIVAGVEAVNHESRDDSLGEGEPYNTHIIEEEREDTFIIALSTINLLLALVESYLDVDLKHDPRQIYKWNDYQNGLEPEHLFPQVALLEVIIESAEGFAGGKDQEACRDGHEKVLDLLIDEVEFPEVRGVQLLD